MESIRVKWLEACCTGARVTIKSAERRAPSAERRAPSAERRAPSAERRAPSAEPEAMTAPRAREQADPPSPPDRRPPRPGGRLSSSTASAAGGRGLVGFAGGWPPRRASRSSGALALPSTAEAQTPPVCDRTEQVRDQIVFQVPSVSTCGEVTVAHLAEITSLHLRSAGITSLKEGDFNDLTALTNLDLHDNSPSDLPAGVFDGLTALRDLDLSDNSLLCGLVGGQWHTFQVRTSTQTDGSDAGDPSNATPATSSRAARSPAARMWGSS